MNQWTLMVQYVVPYVRTTQEQKRVDKAYKRYARWKLFMRAKANVCGFPDVLEKRYRYEVHSCVTWKKAARADLDNAAIKNVLDALWAQDRRVSRITAESIENHGADSLTVTVLEKVSTTGRAGRKVSARREKDRGGRASVPASTDPYSREFRRSNQRRDA